MFTPSYSEFCELTKKGNLVPVYREHLADLETPVSTLSRFADDQNVFLFESVEGGERWGRYSFIGVNPRAIFMVKDGIARVTTADGQSRDLDGDVSPFMRLRQLLHDTKPVAVSGLPRFFAGAVGFLGYETVGEFERLPKPKEEKSTATARFMLVEDMLIFDNVRHTIKVVSCARPQDFDSLEEAYQDACTRIEALEKRIRSPRAADFDGEPTDAKVELVPNMSRDDFCSMVRRAKHYIQEGDIIQTVLSQRFSGKLEATPLATYRALRLINPSPYMYYFKSGTELLVGSSPEIMVRLTGNSMELRPIAGTRPRGQTEQEDRELADSLLADEKERAEHVMLVDLGRNDLGRVAVAGSVQVRDFMTIERYSHVMHIVSHVQAELQEGKDAFDVIRATFPAGTLSGAPKIRAMEIINELEPQSRGPYGGAVGYIGYDGNMDLAITIRTLEIDGHTVSVQAGAGIVADSDPQLEYEETVNKAKGMVRALELAARNLSFHREDDSRS